jgi:hypothetical protein
MGQQSASVQGVDLYRPIVGTQAGPPPIALRIGVANTSSISEGVPSGALKAETYVMLSCLPEELRRRVELAVQVIIASR